MTTPAVTAKDGYAFTAPIAWKDAAKRLVYGPVLIPDQPDSDGDVVSADKIEAVAHKFLEEYRIMEHMHTLRAIARPVESYIAPSDLQFNGERVPKGSWIVGAKVQDDGAWADVEKGTLTGFSIVAVPTGARKSEATKKTTLRDIEEAGSDWEVIAIGLVDKPAVPMAKWLSVKSEADNSFWERLKDLMGLAEQASQKHEDDPTKGGDDMNEEQIAETVGSAITEALKPLGERLDALEQGGINEEEEEEAKKTEDAGVSEDRIKELIAEGIASGIASAGEDFESQLEETLEKKFAKKSAHSLAESLRGQDGHSVEKKTSSSTRDPWGRKIKEVKS